ncbi:MAG: hypothetical protein OZ921_11600 [Sorangiineae bacterium]|nr:hypothetical protein [Polyangiaceae bacterium]MEB2323151.1 hypothetical protein [Sorangiineae bacterium]
MIATRWFGALLLAAGVGVASCSSSSDGGGSGPVPLEELPHGLATSICGLMQQCFGDVYEVFMRGQDCVTLTERQLAQQSLSVIGTFIDDGTVQYHGDQVKGCLSAITARGCSLFAERLPSECEGVFVGSVAVGGDCTITEECVPGSVCLITGGTCPGKCSPRVAAGAACSEDSECVSGLNCQKGRCVAPAAQGEACGGAAPACLGGLFCAGEDEDKGVSGTCAPLDTVFGAARGESCDATAGKLCAPGSSCQVSIENQSVTWTCVAPVTSGAACKLAFPDTCPIDEYCRIAAGANPPIEGSCAKLPGVGEDCSESKVCQPYMACDASTKKCVALTDDGGSCTSDDSCYSKHCVNGKCRAGLCTN